MIPTKHDGRAGRRARIVGLLGVGLAVLTWSGTVMQSAALGVPADGTVTRLADFPNDFTKFDQYRDMSIHAGEISDATVVVADPTTHLLLQINAEEPGVEYPQASDCTSYSPPMNYTATEWVEYDTRTESRLTAVCGLPPVLSEQAFAGSTKGSAAVVDNTDHLVFVPCRCGTLVNGDSVRLSIMAVREQPLAVAGDFCIEAIPGDQCTSAATATSGGSDGSATLPALSVADGPYRFLEGLSWYAPTDDLLALTDNMTHHSGGEIDTSVLGDGATSLPDGVAVTDYHVSWTAGVLGLTERWTIHIPGTVCHRSLTTPFGTMAAAYRGEESDDPALFIPCTTNVSTPTTTIVKLPLAEDGQPLGDPLTDPSVRLQLTVAPVPTEDLLFDPRSERGYFLPTATSATGMTLALYDGGGPRRAPGFTARVRVGSSQFNSYGFDPDTGRLYVEDALGDGLMLVDGRLKQGQGYAAYPYSAFATKLDVGTWHIATLPPDEAHPYRRLVIPNVTSSTTDDYMKYFTVVADRVPVSADVPPADVDGNTYAGTIPQGADVSTTYSGHAAGYGLHSITVGGYGGILQNVFSNGKSAPVPFGNDTLDVAAGAVQDSKLADGTAQASATSLSDVNGNAARAYRACSDAASPQSCDPPPGCPVSNSADPCSQAAGMLTGQSCPTPDPSGGACNMAQSTSTAQDWPYPTVECSDPGPPALEGDHEVAGSLYTPTHSTDASSTPPSARPAPVNDGATASADCSNGAVSAAGRLGCTSASINTTATATAPDTQCQGTTTPLVVGTTSLAPYVTVANAWSETSISPPVNGIVTTRVTAVAQGIHIDLGDGGALDITQVAQVVWAQAGGRPGTAHTARQILIQGITLAQPGEPDSHLCVQQAGCAGDQALLDKLNELDPSHLYAMVPQPDEPFGVERDGISPAGSPGGYLAQVWASKPQQQGDTQFNDMNGWSGTEQELLPALRLVLNNPGSATTSRQILDYAGVEADASLGVQVSDSSGVGGPVSVETTQSLVEAGVPPSRTYVPGTTGFPGQPAAAASSYPPGLLGVFERALTGLGWLIRSPLGGLQMAAFLVLLGLPAALMRRRWA